MAGIPKQIKNNLFTVGERVGKGAFGDVYKAKMKDGKDVAIKFEERKGNNGCLQNEISVYQKLKRKHGFGKLIAHGKSFGYNFMAMEFLGPSVQQLFTAHGRKFGPETVSMIGVKLLDRLEVLHSENIIHCDLKPENVVVGKEDKTELFLIDFGLSKTIMDANETLRINRILGTPSYISIGAHEYIVSKRNDIESLAYLLIYLIRGDLPWDVKHIAKNLKDFEVRTILNAMYELKKTFNGDHMQELPPPIGRFLAASKNISHVQRPNYDALRGILKSNVQFSHFDWEN